MQRYKRTCAAFLQDNMEVIVEFIEGKPVNVELPTNVVQTVVETEMRTELYDAVYVAGGDRFVGTDDG